MKCSILLTTFFFTITFVAKAQLSAASHKRIWTVPEVKEWISKNKGYSTWHGSLLYQGSDSVYHHFISRIMDGWVWFNMPRNDLPLSEERIYSTKSSARLGYYYVDGEKGFVKVKDY